MAKVGEALTTPEAGWKRFNHADTNFSYIKFANGLNIYSDKYATNVIGTEVNFNFTGTKLRIIAGIMWDGSKKVRIIIDGNTETFSQYNAAVITNCLCYEKLGLTNSEHSVQIIQDEAKWTYFGSVDIDEMGELKPYNPTPAPVILGPANLTATAGDAQVTLSWTAANDATGYNVKRATVAGGPYTTIATKVTGTSYVDKDVTNGTTYYYVVTAVTEKGESANSNEASATPAISNPTPGETGQSLLRVTMIDSSEREYRLSKAEVKGFVDWYTRTLGTGISCYAINDIVDNSKEYLSFEKIISFKVLELTK